MGFADFKNRLQSNTNIDKVRGQIESQNKSYRDDRYWTFEVDKTGNGMAIIRFLPEPDGEDLPFVKVFEHSFKDKKTGKWYIEKSLTTLGKDDPVSESNSELWNTGIEANKDIARSRKRQTRYISNVYIVSDPQNPANEGKVMLFKYGQQIFEMIENAISPKFEGEVAINPYDLWKGANFKLKAYNKSSGLRSYDKSSFDNPSALLDGDDAKLEKVYNQIHSLAGEIAPEKFKSYDELKKHFNAVIGISAPAARQAPQEDNSVVETITTSNTSSDDDTGYEGLLD